MIEVAGLGRTDQGHVRTRNEDAVLVDLELGLAVVCDGMGGHAGGDVAAALAVATIESSFREHRDSITDAAGSQAVAGRLSAVLSGGFRRACRDIYSRATSTEALAGMGCAATAVAFGATYGAMAHVGDTRLYLVRNGRAHQLSLDHTLGAELLRQGTIALEDLEQHRYRNVLTRALGTQPSVEVETLVFEVVDGDRLVLCSDGLTNYLPSAEWLADSVASLALEEIPDFLTDHALHAGGADNVTVAAVDVREVATGETRQARSAALAIDVLGSSYLFGDLTLAQLTRVFRVCESRRFEPMQPVWNVGDMVESIVIVLSGRLGVDGGGQHVTLGRGAHLGEAHVLRPRPSRARVVALEPTDALVLSGAALRSLVRGRPWLGVDLLVRLCERLSGDLERFGSSARAARDLL